ncbi:uncharacterized protein LACBIDRAFT_335910 [Laccaria bicolor S238N-H82]|uniref:Predicted protein n=1 Tax=Laccaria bicolor (strain S238N-H82 / ATCC MYA-4686) TaxID=486041 RepID=B0E3T2_LACBS|nr:uncharacterized protein LACBIDRAFT_335910 [Laccaria bicolor S238N-H82]EDQ98499.1 predicted protein [Laccaria bicolor S238N-H82]|eukprot:XP_001890850.1 predicted protein [Laccaria bicolor S238N-H82]
MTGLLSLPTELLQDIGAEVATSPEVRIVAMSPSCRIHYYRDPRKALRLVLSTIKLSPIHLSSQVKSLATTEPKPTSASKYATCLEIHGLYPRDDEDVPSGEEAKVRSFLFPAVASLTGVRRVIWDLGASDPEWAVLLVLDALASLPLLQDLHLKSFLNITHLNLSGLFVKLDATLIPHLRSLISLHLRNIFSTEDQASGNPGSSTENIWSSLRLENIHLQDIVTDDVQLALIEYLTSFSGLRCLRLTYASRYTKSPPTSDQLAIMFYERALQNHVRSLESLEIDAGYEGNWCFANHCSGIIKQCACLTSLKLSIDSKDIGEEDDDDAGEDTNDDDEDTDDDAEDEDGNNDGDDDDGDGDEEHSYPGRGNHNAIVRFQEEDDDNDDEDTDDDADSEDEDGNEDGDDDDGDSDEEHSYPGRGNRNAMWLLLDICANLPVLRAVELLSASPESTRGDRCGYTAGIHLSQVNGKIANRVKSYGPITPGHAFRVSTVCEEFELRCDDLGMNVGYRRISTSREY